MRNLNEFTAFRNKRQKIIHSYLQAVGWVTKEFLAEKFNNKKVAKQVHDKIKQIAGT